MTHWTKLSNKDLYNLAARFVIRIIPSSGWQAVLEPLSSLARSILFYDSFFVKLWHPPTEDGQEILKRGVLLCVPLEHLAFLHTLEGHLITQVIDANVQAAIAGSLPIPPGNQYPSFFFDAALGLDGEQEFDRFLFGKTEMFPFGEEAPWQSIPDREWSTTHQSS